MEGVSPLYRQHTFLTPESSPSKMKHFVSRPSRVVFGPLRMVSTMHWGRELVSMQTKWGVWSLEINFDHFQSCCSQSKPTKQLGTITCCQFGTISRSSGPQPILGPIKQFGTITSSSGPLPILGPTKQFGTITRSSGPLPILGPIKQPGTITYSGTWDQDNYQSRLRPFWDHYLFHQ